MRVLWFSNNDFSEEDAGSTSIWLDAMAHSLVATAQAELFNIAVGLVKAPIFQLAL
jgi:hypothetical protein